MLYAASHSSGLVFAAKTALTACQSQRQITTAAPGRSQFTWHMTVTNGLPPGNTQRSRALRAAACQQGLIQSPVPSLRAHLSAGDEDEEDYDSEDSGDSGFEEDFLPRSSVVIEEINDEAILAAKRAGGIMVSAANTEVSIPGALNGLVCRDEHSQGRDWPGDSSGSRHRGEHGDSA